MRTLNEPNNISTRLFLFVLSFSVLLPVSLSVSFSVAQHAIPPEAWIEMRKVYQANVQATTVAEEIAALAGPEARRTGPRLIDRGPVVLPKIHEALLEEDIDPRKAISLLQIIQSMEDESSVDIVLELLERDPKLLFKRDALLTLAILPATERAAEYILRLAKDERIRWRIRRMAFTWWGLHQDGRGRPFAEALLKNPDPEKQATGLFVLARLGDSSSLEPITIMLQEGAPANMRDALLSSLALLVSPDEFVKRAPESLNWSSGYKNSLLYSRYLYGPKNEKPSVCESLLRSSHPGHLKTAVRCLLDTGHAETLRPHAALSLEAPGRDALIRNEIRKAGWQVIDTETEFRIEKGIP